MIKKAVEEFALIKMKGRKLHNRSFATYRIREPRTVS